MKRKEQDYGKKEADRYLKVDSWKVIEEGFEKNAKKFRIDVLPLRIHGVSYFEEVIKGTDF